VLAGKAPTGTEVAVAVRRHGTWHRVARDSSGGEDGSYQVAVRARPSGVHRYRANATGAGKSRTVRIHVKRHRR
jgi:hypothetical protein